MPLKWGGGTRITALEVRMCVWGEVLLRAILVCPLFFFFALQGVSCRRPMAQFVRIKRDRHTYFLHADPEDSVASLKRELCRLLPDRNFGQASLTLQSKSCRKALKLVGFAYEGFRT